MNKHQNLKTDDKQEIEKLIDKEEKVEFITIVNIIPNQEYQRIIDDKDIELLANSIKEKGQQTPIDVRVLKNNQFENIDGNAKLA